MTVELTRLLHEIILVRQKIEDIAAPPKHKPKAATDDRIPTTPIRRVV